jgi:NTE family protein
MARLALVLAGGGAKGDFEVGALQYVYRHRGLADVLCTTSVGSVNGLKLAEGETGPDSGLAGLTSVWLSLTSYADFFAPADWLQGDARAMQWLRQSVLDLAAPNASDVERRLATAAVADPLPAEVPATLEALRRAETLAVSERRAALSAELEEAANLELWEVAAIGVAPTIGLGVSFGQAVAYLLPLVDAARGAAVARSVFTLAPLWERTQATLDRGRVAAWADRGGQLRMTVVNLHSGDLRYVTERGDVLERDGRPAMSGVSISPACEPAAAAVAEAEERVELGRDMITRRIPGGREVYESGRADLVSAKDALAGCLNKNPPREQRLGVDVVSGMIASATMPTYFPAVPLHAGEEYVDGGVRMVLPVEPAVTPSLGLEATEVVAIAASKMAPDWSVDQHFLLLNAALRSVGDLAINEIARRDLLTTGTGQPPVIVVAPRVDTTPRSRSTRRLCATAWRTAGCALRTRSTRPASRRTPPGHDRSPMPSASCDTAPHGSSVGLRTSPYHRRWCDSPR